MAKFNARQSVLIIEAPLNADGTSVEHDADGTLRDMSTFISSVDGLPGEVERPEVTTLGDQGRTHLQGLENVTVTVEGFFDDTDPVTDSDDFAGPDRVFSLLRKDDRKRTIRYSPNGITSGATGTEPSGPKPFTNAIYRTGAIVYYGQFKLRNYMITSRVGETVTFRAEMLIQGIVSRGEATPGGTDPVDLPGTILEQTF